jgi:hypothetical protein
MATTLREEFVRPPLAPRREREAYIRQFKLEQMTSNEWISFERAVSCLTGQRDLATASDARRTLLDAICAGKIHRDNPRALQCQDASSGDDWHWSVSDFRALVEHREGLESVLKNTYFERDSLLPWMKGCGFEPTADIQSHPLKSALNPNDQKTGSPAAIPEVPAHAAEDDEQPINKLSIPFPKELATAKQIATHRALCDLFPDRGIPWPQASMESLTKRVNLKLAKLCRTGAIDIRHAKTSEKTIRRVLGLS